MNILFVNYGDFTTASINHIGGFANALTELGHSCIVAVPSGKETLSGPSRALFLPALYREVLERPSMFPDGRIADVIHAWTPRECVRKFVVAYQRAIARSARLIVHLEDNEEALISTYTRRSIAELRSMGFGELESLITDSLTHPARHRMFLRMANQATVILDRLKAFVPASVPCSLLYPGVDPGYLGNVADPALRGELGLGPDEKVVVFTGSNTFANELEIRDLYAAIRLLNERGTPTRLVRTGLNGPQFQRSLAPELRAHVLDLGFVAKGRLPGLVALADALVQPGRLGPFNDFRLPSKLPEFLASGRPVILPPTNIALEMKDGVEAVFLSAGTPEDIADCCERIFRDPALAASLGRNGAAFARRHFDLAANAAGLLKTYEAVLTGPARAGWDRVRREAASDLTVLAEEVAEALQTGSPGVGGSQAALPEMAADLAVIVRLEDQRQTSGASASDRRLEESIRQLELQRDLTGVHVRNLESRMIGIERAARTRIDALSKESASAASKSAEASREHEKLAARIVEMDRELVAREKRLKAIVNSAAWKLLAPARDIERFFRWVASRMRPAVPGEGPVIGGAGPEAAFLPVPAVSSLDASGPTREYSFHFDHPRDWNTSSDRLLILGWCFENSALPIRGVRARVGSEVFEGTYGVRRPEVLAAKGKEQASHCGFRIEASTRLGDHPLVVEVLHDDGWHPFFTTAVHAGKPGDPRLLSEYEKWCQEHEALDAGDKGALGRHIAAFGARPVFSVIMPVYDPPEELLTKAIQSVVDQIYPFWELCIADDASTLPHVRRVMERFAAAEPRIRVAYRPSNGHISEASNTAIERATGDFIAFLDHDDVLAATALYEVAAEIDSHPDAQFIYTDEDKIDVEDRRFDPYFKPDWNPDLNNGQNYTSHLSVYRSDLVRALGGLRSGFEGSQDWDLVLRASDRIPASAIRHIPRVLYHWRAAPGSTALQLAEKGYPVEAARRALLEHFRRRGETVELLPVPGDHWRVRYPLPSPPPFVSLIIPTRNALHLVRQALDSILKVTDYPGFEILVVDNGSDDPATVAYLEDVGRSRGPQVRILPFRAPFNYSAINNFALGEARGQVIGFLNNDVEAFDAGWLSEMVSQACRPGIGAVGAMLYFPNNTLQHAGVILGLGGVAGHPWKEFPRGGEGQKNRLRLAQNYSAVTGACMLILRDRFLEVGGFNEKELPIAFNDVDLCCKLIKAGYRNVWTPYAELYHHESATRGIDDTPEKLARFHGEIEYMTKTWGHLLMSDPAYNPNLSLVSEDFSLAYVSRAARPWMAHLR